eukprot:9717060-Alexandrium_andersonii.AAC.1
MSEASLDRTMSGAPGKREMEEAHLQTHRLRVATRRRHNVSNDLRKSQHNSHTSKPCLLYTSPSPRD